ncbi:MAG: CPBP family intramembrane metalloprotease [Paracoccus sp. (in: a-proteobacteria)]|nr:CPBP family intramembrane metalloprotease [Paracoccus sp. (in: a-proteobacteria)]
MSQLFRNRLAALDLGWKWWFAVIAAVGITLAGMIPALLAAPLTADAGLISLLNMAALAIIPLGLLALAHRRLPSRERLGLRFDLLGRDLAIGFAAVLIVNVVFELLARLMGDRIGGADTGALVADGFGQGLRSDALMMLIVVVLAPWAEELAYRAGLFRALHDGLGRSRALGAAGAAAIAVALSALIFALAHSAPGEPSFIPYLIVSAMFPLVYLWSGSLTAAILAHSLQSSFAWGMLLYRARGEIEVAPVLFVIVLGGPALTLALSWLTARLLPAR